MRLLRRIVLGLVVLIVALAAVLIAASFVFNLATNGKGKPVQALWHGRFITADGVLTAYREWGTKGKGTPIVLIGGFLEPTFVWDSVGPRLARAGHRVYALDLDGFGYTERHGPWTLDEWSNQVEDFMHELGIEKPVVVGHSLGAAVAVELVRRGLTSRLVLLDGDALTTGGPPNFLRRAVAETPLVTSAVRLSTMWDWPVKEILANAYGPDHPKLDHAMAEQWTDQFRAAGADHALVEIVKHGVVGFSRSQLQSVRAKTTVIWGGKDNVDSISAGRQTARDLRARFVLIPRAGHLGLLSTPALVARAIERS